MTEPAKDLNTSKASYYYYYYYYYYCIDRSIYLNLSKSTQSQSATGPKALKPAADRRHLTVVRGEQLWRFFFSFPFGA